MATSTLIQKLFAADESGVGEDSTTASFRVQKETFRASAAITAGAAVVFSTVDGGSGEVVMKVKPATDAAIGVATAAAAQDAFVDVVISGICEAKVEGKNAGGNTAIASGDYLCVGAVSGVFYKYTPGTDPVPHAIAVDAVASGAAAALKTVVVLKQF
jgi:hypothetical protein